LKLKPHRNWCQAPPWCLAPGKWHREKHVTKRSYCLFNASTGGKFEAFIAGYTPNKSPEVSATNTAILIESRLTTAESPYFATILIAQAPRTIPATHPIMLT